jgi:hypothetical protein
MAVMIELAASEEMRALYPGPDAVMVGPFEFAQLTYTTLRVGPDGDWAAALVNGLWRIFDEVGNAAFAPYAGMVFSDITVIAAE